MTYKEYMRRNKQIADIATNLAVIYSIPQERVDLFGELIYDSGRRQQMIESLEARVDDGSTKGG